MNNKKYGVAFAAILATTSLALGGCSNSATESPSAATPAEWSYSGEKGPEAWGSLDESYAACADGTAQSPIDITATSPTDLPNIEFSYEVGEAGIFNNGHTVEAEPLGEGADTIKLDGTVYPFLQFHFHAPSEHAVNGKNYPLEVHFVHKTEDGKIAVVGVFVEEGAANPAWDPFIENIAKATEDPEATTVEIDWLALLPSTQITARYDGSLTTPGCAEGVKWNVMTTPITMSAEQIAAFTGAYSGNARPVQPLNDRVVLLDTTE